jgi:hypothetical protein
LRTLGTFVQSVLRSIRNQVSSVGKLADSLSKRVNV